MGIAIIKEKDLLQWATLKEQRRLAMITDRSIYEHLIDHWRLEHDANADNERAYSTGDGYEIQWWND